MRAARVIAALSIAVGATAIAADQSDRHRSAAGTSLASIDPTLRAELVAARDRIWRGWFANDRAVLDAMLPPEFVGIGFGGGPFDTRESAVKGAADFAAGGGKLRRLEFQDDRVQVFGDVVTLFSNYVLEFEVGGEKVTQSGRATEIFVRRDGRWTNPAWHLDSGK
jgi:hypothetical protein